MNWAALLGVSAALFTPLAQTAQPESASAFCPADEHAARTLLAGHKVTQRHVTDDVTDLSYEGSGIAIAGAKADRVDTHEEAFGAADKFALYRVYFVLKIDRPWIDRVAGEILKHDGGECGQTTCTTHFAGAGEGQLDFVYMSIEQPGVGGFSCDYWRRR